MDNANKFIELMELRIAERKKFSQAMGKMTSVATDHWSIPAYRSAAGAVTCIGADKCAKAAGCYAMNGRYRMTNVIAAHEANLALSKDMRFTEVMVSEISRRKKIKAYRIHTSGDFYSLAYLMEWFAIIRNIPGVQFYAYTKMVPMFKHIQANHPNVIPANFTVIFSEGGKWDHLIDTSRDRHSRVFSSVAELMEAGYTNTSKDDTYAWQSVNHRIGLVYHGAASKEWTTS